MADHERWRLSRAGLINFWFYENQIFEFENGHLLLRGANGAGKTVTMQSLLPLLLDGNRAPHRIDPFGSRTRRLEYYLLGEGEASYQERTAYLFLELRKGDSYKTIGWGFQARKDKEMRGWGFLIRDGRRVGIDLQLSEWKYQETTGEKTLVPLTRPELERRLGNGGEVFTQQGEYASRVNAEFFGFDKQTHFQDYLNLLINLRSPKLSRDFKPSYLSEILTNSLPGLSEDETRPLSEAIQNMNTARDRTKQLDEELKKVTKLAERFRVYLQAVLLDKLAHFMEALKRERSHRREDERLERERERFEQEYRALGKRRQELAQELDALNQERDVLAREDAFALRQRLSQLQEERGRRLGGQKELSSRLRNKQLEFESALQEAKLLEKKLDEAQRLLARSEQGLVAQGEKHRFLFHDEFIARWRNQQEGGLLKPWKQALRELLHQLERVLAKLRELTAQNHRALDLQRKLEEARLERDKARDQWESACHALELTREQFGAQFEAWLKRLPVPFELPAKAIRDCMQAIASLYEDCEFSAVQAPARVAIEAEVAQLQDRQSQHRVTLGEWERQLSERRKELRHWQERAEPEPPRSSATDTARARLELEGVPFVPFFAAVEFADSLGAQERERIEAAVAQMGLLDALIVPAKQAEKMRLDSDRVICHRPVLLGRTLRDLLVPTPPSQSGLKEADVEAALESLAFEDKIETSNATLVLDGQGNYALGPMRGHAPQEARERGGYIGREARLRLRQQNIERLEAQIEELLARCEKEREAIASIKALIEALRQALAGFPSEREMRLALDARQRALREFELRKEALQRYDKDYELAMELVHRTRAEAQKLAFGLDYRLDEGAFQVALDGLRAYEALLHELEIGFARRLSLLNEGEQLAQRKLLLNDQLEGFRGESLELEDELRRVELEIGRVEARLAASDIAALEQRMRTVLADLRRVPDEIAKNERRQGECDTQIQRLVQEIGARARQRELDEELTAHWRRIFMSELEACPLDGKLGERLEAWRFRLSQGGDLIVAVADELESELRKFTVVDREKAIKELTRCFDSEIQNLVDYRPQLGEREPWTGATPPDVSSDDALWKELPLHAGRIHITLEYEGQNLHPLEAHAAMERDLLLQQLALTEQDRELYETVILRNLGRIISERVFRTKSWVEQINELMERTRMSSGIELSLEWREREFKDEEGLAISELVQLLHSKPELLKAEDKERLLAHFHARVRAAEAQAHDGRDAQGIESALREALDFRHWFVFKLFMRRGNEKRRDLTDQRFQQLSGGERALSMYMPLFSAVASRFEEANRDAPHPIALDEAFAGVDTNNIGNMFELMETLDFDYILTSQALWGELGSVRALAIYELTRRDEFSGVTALRFSWQGAGGWQAQSG